MNRRITDTTTLIIIDSSEVVPKKSKQDAEQVFWLYVTNMPVTDGNIAGICRYYDARWGIETGYRIDDHEFTGMTNIAQRCHPHLLSPPLRHTQEHMDAAEGGADREGHEWNEGIRIRRRAEEGGIHGIRLFLICHSQ